MIKNYFKIFIFLFFLNSVSQNIETVEVKKDQKISSFISDYEISASVQPSLQCWNRAAYTLAYASQLATFLEKPHSDVSKRGRAKSRGPARQQGLWAACHPRPMAQRGENCTQPAPRCVYPAPKSVQRSYSS